MTVTEIPHVHGPPPFPNHTMRGAMNAIPLLPTIPAPNSLKSARCSLDGDVSLCACNYHGTQNKHLTALQRPRSFPKGATVGFHICLGEKNLAPCIRLTLIPGYLNKSSHAHLQTIEKNRTHAFACWHTCPCQMCCRTNNV